MPRIIFTSSTSVYGDVEGVVKETTERRPVTASGKVLKELEDWLHNLPGTQVDILRLAGLVGPGDTRTLLPASLPRWATCGESGASRRCCRGN